MTVDDDPGVSRAVGRDLRRRYGERHRIVRAESGAAGLEALREMKLRGDLVAGMLAGHPRPPMYGIELLQPAIRLYPRPQCTLLTTYCRTRSAIYCINV